MAKKNFLEVFDNLQLNDELRGILELVDKQCIEFANKNINVKEKSLFILEELERKVNYC